MPNLFENQLKDVLSKEAPLAARIRPRDLNEFVGQEHLVGPNTLLRNAICSDKIPSMILWGAPATGKTTLARIISRSTGSHFETVSAVNAGVSDLRKIVDGAKERLSIYRKKTIVFIDEIHRFNKAQQDVILPQVEEGIFTLIGATTENPSFAIIPPLLSRCSIFTLKTLSDEHVNTIVQHAIKDVERGLGSYEIQFFENTLEQISFQSNGDPRSALNLLEIIVTTTKKDENGIIRIYPESLSRAINQRLPMYDKSGDQHYNIISAFIKSIRGSDPDATIYWLSRMLEAGENPLFIARRLIISASEDISLADPNALSVAVAAQQAVHFLGMPEGSIPLAQASIYLATAPKSNASYAALKKATEDVNDKPNEPVPLHLRNAINETMKNAGHGSDYKYPHEFSGNFVPQNYLPESLTGNRYYYPNDEGYEKTIRERLTRWWSDYRD